MGGNERKTVEEYDDTVTTVESGLITSSCGSAESGQAWNYETPF